MFEIYWTTRWHTVVIFPQSESFAFCFLCNILSVKKAAKSLHDLLDSNSEGTDLVGVVTSSTTENNAWVLLLFSLITSEINDCLFNYWLKI